MAVLQDEVKRKSGARSGSGNKSASAKRSARKLKAGKGFPGVGAGRSYTDLQFGVWENCAH